MSQNSQLFNKKAIMLLLLGVVGLYAHHDVSAATTCSFTSGGTTSFAIPLQTQNITVGPDTPNGTIVYRQYSVGGALSPFRCTASSTAYKATSRHIYTANPKPLSSWNDSPYPGAVYETGVPGLGVVFWYYGVAFPSDRSVNNVSANTIFTSNNLSPSVSAEFDMYIIKIGPVSAGTIKGSDLPSASMRFLPEGGNTLVLDSVSFTGSINIVSQTCQTPDVNVPMGKVGITTFKGKGTTSVWQDASIRLTNCPRFYGTRFVASYYPSSDPNFKSSIYNSANSLSLNLTPNTSIIDSAKGIMGIKAGAGSASGVGIQLAYGQASDTSPTVVSFANSRSYTMTNDSSTTQTLPLVARYIQTDDQVTPGRADGTATFTINYY